MLDKVAGSPHLSAESAEDGQLVSFGVDSATLPVLSSALAGTMGYREIVSAVANSVLKTLGRAFKTMATLNSAKDEYN